MPTSSYMEISDGKSKIKVEINKFFEKAIKQFKPETVDSLIEQLQKIKDENQKNFNEQKPRVGESFNDLFGKSYKVIGKDNLSEKPKVLLRRGNLTYAIESKKLYDNDGNKLTVNCEDLKESEVLVKY